MLYYTLKECYTSNCRKGRQADNAGRRDNVQTILTARKRTGKAYGPRPIANRKPPNLENCTMKSVNDVSNRALPEWGRGAVPIGSIPEWGTVIIPCKRRTGKS